MTKVTSENAFESSIESHLLSDCWATGNPKNYDVSLGLMPEDLTTFLQSSQPDEWGQLCSRLGGPTAAGTKVAKYVADQITKRGTVDVLRRETKMNGVTFRLAFFAPANGLTPELWKAYDANRLTIVRQLHHSESRPADSL